MASRVLRFQLFTWVGIVGGVITIFTHLKEVLHLAEWAKWLVTNWQSLTLAFWQFWFGWIGVRLTETAALALSLVTFTIAVAVGARSDYRRTPDLIVLSPKLQRRLQRAEREKRWLLIIGLASFLALVAYNHNWGPLAHQPISQLIVRELGTALLFLMWWGGGYVFTATMPKYPYVDRAIFLLMQGFVFAAFIAPFALSWSKNMTGNVLDTWEFLRFMVLAAAFLLPTIIMVIIAPMRALNRRLSFLAIGFLGLVLLNEVSYYAPYIREWLRPPI
jgi:hypothetical protein